MDKRWPTQIPRKLAKLYCPDKPNDEASAKNDRSRIIDNEALRNKYLRRATTASKIYCIDLPSYPSSCFIYLFLLGPSVWSKRSCKDAARLAFCLYVGWYRDFSLRSPTPPSLLHHIYLLGFASSAGNLAVHSLNIVTCPMELCPFHRIFIIIMAALLSLAWLLLCGIINQAGPKKSDLSYSSSAAASLVAYETMLGKSPCRLYVLVIVHRPLSTCSSPLPSTPPLQRYNNNTIPQTRIKSCPDCPQQQQLHILYMPIRASKRYLILHESSADPLITINWSPGLVVVWVLIFFDYARVHYLLPENEEYNIIVLFDLSTKASKCLGANWSSEQTANGGGV